MAMKCNHCAKFFESETYLKKHYQKKHPQQDYEVEFPSPVQVQKQQEQAQKQLQEEQKKHQEQLFDTMKHDLVKNLNTSIGTLEKEILQVKVEQNKLESLGKTSESEQKRID